jgi:hypothetical protein
MFESNLDLTSHVSSGSQNQFVATISNLKDLAPNLIKIHSVTSEMILVDMEGQTISVDCEFHSFILYTYTFQCFLVKPNDHLKS